MNARELIDDLESVGLTVLDDVDLGAQLAPLPDRAAAKAIAERDFRGVRLSYRPHRETDPEAAAARDDLRRDMEGITE